MLIGDFNTTDRLLIMAEIGNNHEGRPEVARELVERAAEAGAGAVKLQVFEAERFVRPRDHDRLEQLRGFQLPPEEISALCKLAHELDVLVIATPLDLESLRQIEPLVDGLKIASGDNDCIPLIEAVAATGRPMIVSSGLAELPEIKAAVNTVEGRWDEQGINGELAVLHCVSAYPVDGEAADLGRIPALIEALDCTVGYSDHTLGIEACVAAAGLGARIIEKHFTLDHEFSGFRDHALSAEPDELAELVRRAEAAASEPSRDAPPPRRKLVAPLKPRTARRCAARSSPPPSSPPVTGWVRRT